MNGHLEHHDVIRVTGQSHESFDDAVRRALQQLSCPRHGHNHHPNMTFRTAEVVKLTAHLHHDRDRETCQITHYNATIDVEAVHDH